MSDHIDWPRDLSELSKKVREDILTEWRDSEHNSHRDYPSARWLRSNGYSSLRRILRDHHDLGLPEFFEIILNLTDDESGFNWNIEDPETIKQAEEFLERHKETKKFQENTKNSYRSHLNSVFRNVTARHGEISLYGVANDPTRSEEIYELYEDVFIELQNNHPDGTTYAYLRIIQRFYDWLARRDRIIYHPIKELGEEFNFDQNSNTTPLRHTQVRKLWSTADSLREYLVIIGYVFWGIRTEELARISKDQFILESADPRYEFQTRKNGPGTVSVEIGLEYVTEKFERREKESDFDGALFDVHSRTLKREFNDLADRAGVTIDGESANPEHGRNYWMKLRNEAHLVLLEAMKEFNYDRGAKNPKQALVSYTDEKTRRKYRRLLIRDQLEDLLEEDATLSPKDYLSDIESQSTIQDFINKELSH